MYSAGGALEYTRNKSWCSVVVVVLWCLAQDGQWDEALESHRSAGESGESGSHGQIHSRGDCRFVGAM